MSEIILKKGKEKSLLRHHPWIFSGAVLKIKGSPESGETVEIKGSDGKLYARGAYSEKSQISVRVWSFDETELIDDNFFKNRIITAIQMRKELAENKNSYTAFRLINSESDSLPGVIVDKYGDFLVCQFLTAGAEQWKKTIVEILNDLIPNKGLYERSDADARLKEGLGKKCGVLSGEDPSDSIEIKEGELTYLVDIKKGHKTGFYLDQRENRKLLLRSAENKDVLNCFAYTGGFGVAALKGKAKHVTNIEASSEALELASKNFELNNLDSNKVENVKGDVFKILRQYRNENRHFDVIILDPPKFIESKKDITKACRGYKDINLLGFQLLKPGGLLFTFSCSGLMTLDLFKKITADAALDAGCTAHIIKLLSQSSDHSISLNFPEANYLKGLIVKKVAPCFC